MHWKPRRFSFFVLQLQQFCVIQWSLSTSSRSVTACTLFTHVSFSIQFTFRVCVCTFILSSSSSFKIFIRFGGWANSERNKNPGMTIAKVESVNASSGVHWILSGAKAYHFMYSYFILSCHAFENVKMWDCVRKKTEMHGMRPNCINLRENTSFHGSTLFTFSVIHIWFFNTTVFSFIFVLFEEKKRQKICFTIFDSM